MLCALYRAGGRLMMKLRAHRLRSAWLSSPAGRRRGLRLPDLPFDLRNLCSARPRIGSRSGTDKSNGGQHPDA